MNSIKNSVKVNQPKINPGVTQNFSYMAQVPVSKWGNSQGIRIPRAVMELLRVKVNDVVEIKVQDEELIISKKKSYKNLQERLESFYNQPIENIFVESKEDIDWGTPQGNEVW